MIHKVEMYGATCDNCESPWVGTHNDWSAVNDEGTLKVLISDDDWHTGDGTNGEDGKHYCPECYHWDKGDNFILKPIT